MAGEDPGGGIILSARDYMRAIAPSGESPFARCFSLVPPLRDRQFRTASSRRND